MMSYEEILTDLQSKLNTHRFLHTLGVADTVRLLAQVHGADEEKAAFAGLLHDCARRWPNERLPEECEKRGIPVSDLEREMPILLHAQLGAALAEEEYGVTDRSILEAIRVHTTGTPAMGPLSKILYIADYIEPGRNMVSNLNQIRRAAFFRPDDALIMILRGTLDYLKKKGGPIHPATLETYQYYAKEEY